MSWNNFNIPPTVSEVDVDERLQQQDGGSSLVGGEESDEASSDTIRALHDSKLEPLMISMLEQRDRLQEQLVRMQKRIEDADERCRDAIRERDSLRRQLETTRQDLPSEVQTLTRELAHCREQLYEKEEEIVELKAERNNTRLLLEHLECLVSKHEKSLRFTVVKRHSQINRDNSVSSEVEVLKALKSLFEHHKALEEKVRERLKVAIERVQSLEVELNGKVEENASLKSKLSKALAEAKKNINENENNIAEGGEKHINSSNKGTSPKLFELQEQLDRMSQELATTINQANELNSRNAELESELSNAGKEIRQAKEQANSAEQQLQELQAQRDEQEDRVNLLENRILTAQRESACLRELNDKLEFQLANKDATMRLNEEKLHSLHERFELAEKQLAQSLKKAESLPSVEAELLQRMEALTAAEQKHLSAEERIQRLEVLLNERSAELDRAVQRERMNEEHNQRLSSTVDKLLSESNERLQVHLKERMQAQIERNILMQQLDQAKKLFDQAERFKERATAENEDLRKEIEMLRNLVYSTRTAQFYSRLNGFPCPPTLPIGSEMEPQPYILPPPRQNAMSTSMPTATPGMVKRRLQKGRAGALQEDPGKIQTLGEKEWDRLQQASVLANIQQAFSSSSSLLNMNNSPSLEQQQPPDPHTLAYVLQERLDAINNEIRLIQEQKQQTERIAAEQMEQQKTSWPPNLPNQVTDSQSAAQFSNSPYDMASYLARVRDSQLNFNEQQMIQQRYHATDEHAPDPNWIRNGSDQVHHQRRFSPRRGTRPDTDRQRQQLQDRISPVSSVGSSPDLGVPGSSAQSNATGSKPPKKSTSTSSGLKTLGRIFGGSQRKKRGTDASSYSDSECGPFTGGSVDNLNKMGHQKLLNGGSTLPITKMASSSYGLPPADFDKRKRRKHELLEESIKARTPFALWNGPTIVAWLELWVGMPTWYTEACRANVKSGAIMSALSDQEIQREIGVSNPLHRLKLRLAIQEMVALTSPSSPRTQQFYSGLAFGEMNHEWIGNEWLPSLGLGRYRVDFMECLVDARMLEHLSKRDLNKSLKIVDSFHRTSLHYGIVCLKKLNYERKQLEERRQICENANKDLLVWSNERVSKWLEEIGLGMFIVNLADSGVHGALMALDETFDVPALAHILQIGDNDQALRVLDTQFGKLVSEYRIPTSGKMGKHQQKGRDKEQQPTKS
uniref:SAM domain-containing protein n=1 Tax=Meloidogyne incognita TaxID=6306 RepID=A0A914LQM2_MELIC